MEIIDNLLSTYLNGTCDEEPALLKHIDRETHLKETMPHMLSGHYQGRLLSMFSQIVAPKRILEVGTFTGYATICLAEGLAADGLLYTLDIEPERQERVQGYFDASGYAPRIRYQIGDARTLIPALNEIFDLVFIDADKKNNLHYYELAIDKTRAGGLILIDNVLWKGKVMDEQPDKQTAQIQQLNQFIATDNRVQKLILPIRDGLFVMRKR